MSNSKVSYGRLTGMYGIQEPGDPVRVPNMPQSLEGVSPQDIEAAYAAIQNSPASYPANVIENLASDRHQLKDWEVKMVEEAYAKFAAKYCSPLAKALK